MEKVQYKVKIIITMNRWKGESGYFYIAMIYNVY
jgi:hypothetical protein